MLEKNIIFCVFFLRKWPFIEPRSNYLQLAEALYEEWLVVQWAKVEQQRLLFYRLNQKKIRAEAYSQVNTQQSLGTQSARGVQGVTGTIWVTDVFFIDLCLFLYPNLAGTLIFGEGVAYHHPYPDFHREGGLPKKKLLVKPDLERVSPKKPNCSKPKKDALLLWAVALFYQAPL